MEVIGIKTHDKKAIYFVLPHFFGVCVFFLLPYLDVFRRSIQIEDALGIEHYKEVFVNGAFRLAMENTFKFISVCVPIILLLSLVIACSIRKQTWYLQLVKKGYLFPLAMPVVSIAFMWKLLFDEYGYVNKVLNVFDVSGIDWMGTDYAFWILIGSYIWRNIGYYIILWLAALSNIPSTLYEAGKIDGATKGQCFWYITRPLLAASLYMMIILSLVNSFKSFREAYLVAGAYPHKSMYLLQHLFNNWFQELDLEKMAAGAIINGTCILVIVIVLKRVLNRGNEYE